MSSAPVQLPGLTASLDQLRYHYAGITLSEDRPHAFIYFITLTNRSKRTVTLLGRKGVLTSADSEVEVVEGDGIVGETPQLTPGESFSYNSYHVTDGYRRVEGSFHGLDEDGRHIVVHIAPFELAIPL